MVVSINCEMKKEIPGRDSRQRKKARFFITMHGTTLSAPKTHLLKSKADFLGAQGGAHPL